LAAVIGMIAAAASARAEESKTLRDFKVSEFRVSDDIGHVSDIRMPALPAPAGPSIVLIQDAHINYDAQMHIAQILEQLVRDHGLRLVMVEGGEGDVSLSYMRKLASADVRREVADRYLRDGMIAGHEYLNLVSDEPLVLWGIDDQELYQKNYAAFMDMEKLRLDVAPELARLQAMVEAVTIERVSTPVREFRAKAEAFAKGDLSLSAYARILIDTWTDLGGNLSNYPHLSRMREAEQAASSVDLARVSQEQRQVVSQLRQVAAQSEMDALTALAKQVRAGGAPEPFYQELRRLADAHGMALSTAPVLSRYIEVLQLRSEIQAKSLWEELDAAREALSRRLCQSDQERQLLAIADALALYKRLIALKWVPRDYRRYALRQGELSVKRWWPVLAAAAQDSGIALTWSGEPAILDQQLASAVAFYDAASLRNAKIAQNVMDKIKAQGVRIAAMVVGGFHTDAVVDLLIGQGASIVIVTPGVGQDADDERKYHDILKMQSEPWVPGTDLERRLGSHAQRASSPNPEGVDRDE
jgi:hypothetical protein